MTSLEDKNPAILENLHDNYAEVFDKKLGYLKVELQVHANAIPKFHKARSVPFMMKEKVEAEFDYKLQQEGIISPVKHSHWASPIVPVMKKDNSVPICGDFKVTINQASPTECYPIPRVEELFSKLSGMVDPGFTKGGGGA